MSERDAEADGCAISLAVFVILMWLVALSIDAPTKDRLGHLERDVQEIRKHLNIPAEPEKEEAK